MRESAILFYIRYAESISHLPILLLLLCTCFSLLYFNQLRHQWIHTWMNHIKSTFKSFPNNLVHCIPWIWDSLQLETLFRETTRLRILEWMLVGIVLIFFTKYLTQPMETRFFQFDKKSYIFHRLIFVRIVQQLHNQDRIYTQILDSILTIITDRYFLNPPLYCILWMKRHQI